MANLKTGEDAAIANRADGRWRAEKVNTRGDRESSKRTYAEPQTGEERATAREPLVV